MTTNVTHHCSECGAQVEGEAVCDEHPNATIDSVLSGPSTRTIERGDENMGTIEIEAWRVGDRVEYPDGASDAAWARVRELLARRGLRLVDDSTGYVVRAPEDS